jgi:hypothetical protein
MCGGPFSYGAVNSQDGNPRSFDLEDLTFPEVELGDQLENPACDDEDQYQKSQKHFFHRFSPIVFNHNF